MKFYFILFFLIVHVASAQMSNVHEIAANGMNSVGQQVTMSDYCSFLNETAKRDVHSLYDEKMGDFSSSLQFVACGLIMRTGEPGNYSYAVAEEEKNAPLHFMNWLDKARYCNWCQHKKKST